MYLLYPQRTTPFSANTESTKMGFKESLLRGRIDGLKNNIARCEKRGEDPQRIKNLKELLAAAERELEERTNPK
jgi:hypothetical protein